MAFADNDGARLYWRSDGEHSKPAILLLNSIATDLGSWDRVVPHLLPQFRVVRMDARGHGASSAPAGDCSFALLARDALAVLDAAGVDTAVVCGVSLGGMTALELAVSAPERVAGLVPACASASLDPVAWEARRKLVVEGGMAAVADIAIQRFFCDRFRRTHPAEVQTVRDLVLGMDAEVYAGCCAALRDIDLATRIGAITAPTLVIGGARDASMPFDDHGRKVAEAIPGAQSMVLDAGHLAYIEAPLDFAAAVRAAFATPTDSADDPAEALFERGLKVRRQVLGDDWVDRSLAARTAFNADFQAMITRVAWNEVWTRPGLDHRTRRLLVVAITAALGRWEEFRLHVRAGIEQDGFTLGELKEVLMQTAVYAGVPAANTAFAEAKEVLAEVGGAGA